MILEPRPDDAGTPFDRTTVDPLDALRRENGRLAAENRRLAELARRNGESAQLQAERAGALLAWAARNEATLLRLYRSTFWQVTAPLRVLARIVGGVPEQGVPPGVSWRAIWRRLGGSWPEMARRCRRDLGKLKRRIADRLHPAAPPRPAGGITSDALFARPVGTPAAAVLAPRVLIVAELTVPQCAKYRVWQKQDLLRRVGLDCVVADWRNAAASRAALQLAGLVVFYRTPGTPEVLGLIAEARRLGVPSRWEVDDAIFDEAVYAANGNLETLDRALRDNLLEGVRLYRAAMLACDGAIASTAALAAQMRAAGVADVAVVENALDAETLDIAAALRGVRRDPGGGLRIVYGSGTRTHDADFARAAAALVRLMDARPEATLRIVGDLALPPAMDRLAERIERFPLKDFRTWLGLLAEADIALAPLEPTAFNDAKSNIKYLEAAILGVPAVCSPRTNFRAVIADGETGLLAEDETAWFAALDRLAGDPRLRRRMGEAARAAVLARYAPDVVAHAQVAPLVAGLDRRARPRLRVLSVNVFFWPRSFGGATIVAEEMARRLARRAGVESFVFTSHRTEREGEYGLRRYEHDGLPVVSVGLPDQPDDIGGFDNPEVARKFGAVLRAVQPDVVHLHSVQGIGATIADTCRALGIPYAVTVHDAWWLCPRQFMVREDGTYCFQRRIDLNLCRACMPGAAHLGQRLDLLLARLGEAALVLSPSRAHAETYAANGIAPERLRVHPNGIRMPAAKRTPRPRGEGIVRFGYVGGTPAVKGYGVLRAAMEGLARDNWTLTLIDNTLNLGFASIDRREWRVRGTVEVAPSYRQEEMDAFFDGIDVLLFPSQWMESFGLTVREALARDVWVIATDCGGPVEDVRDGVNGTIIPMTARPEPLRAAITALLDDPARLAGHVNPEKARLRSFADQEAELFRLLSEIAA
jgi:glycosyltransferase involved in cell wall biosynthesis